MAGQAGIHFDFAFGFYRPFSAARTKPDQDQDGSQLSLG
jgi:hypothetical protein